MHPAQSFRSGEGGREIKNLGGSRNLRHRTTQALITAQSHTDADRLWGAAPYTRANLGQPRYPTRTQTSSAQTPSRTLSSLHADTLLAASSTIFGRAQPACRPSTPGRPQELQSERSTHGCNNSSAAAAPLHHPFNWENKDNWLHKSSTSSPTRTTQPRSDCWTALHTQLHTRRVCEILARYRGPLSRVATAQRTEVTQLRSSRTRNQTGLREL